MRKQKHPSMWMSYMMVVFGALNQSIGAFDGMIDQRYFGLVILAVGLIDGFLSYKSQS